MSVTLEAVPQSWASSRFSVRDGLHQVAELDFASWREDGKIELDRGTFHVRRERMMSGDFILEDASGAIARATKPSAWVRRLNMHYAGNLYEVRARSAFFREFLILHGGCEIGCVKPQSVWTRSAIARVPEEWPAALQVFVLWLILLMWRRETSAGAAAAGGGGDAGGGG